MNNDLKENPFIEEVVDWAKKYKEHLESPDANIPFSQKTGTILRLCNTCFYRYFKTAPDKDCHCGEKGIFAKTSFKSPINEFMPTQIDGKEVGNYCPHWVDYNLDF